LLLCAALAATLVALTHIKVSRETVRLELKAAGYVWKRARLKGRDDDPQLARRLARIRMLIKNQRPDELILFSEVQVVRGLLRSRSGSGGGHITHQNQV
jgi:hypothetical protein